MAETLAVYLRRRVTRRIRVTDGRDLNNDSFFGGDFPNGQRTIRPSNSWKNWYRTVDLRIGKSLLAARQGQLGTRVEF